MKPYVTPEEEEERKKDRKFGRQLLLVIVVIVVGIFLRDVFYNLLSTDKEVKEGSIPYITPKGTIERIVEGVAIKAFGETVNWDNSPYTIKGIKKITQVAGPDEGGYLIEVLYRTDESLSISWVKRGIFIDAIEFTKELFLPSFCEEIKIYMLKPYLILIDKYGKETEEQVAKLVLRRAIAYKVNWRNITSEMFERLLRDEGQLWLHPALNR